MIHRADNLTHVEPIMTSAYLPNSVQMHVAGAAAFGDLSSSTSSIILNNAERVAV